LRINRRFFSLVELNEAVRDCVATINAKVMKPLKQSRNDLFASLDRPALKGLPRVVSGRGERGAAARTCPQNAARGFVCQTVRLIFEYFARSLVPGFRRLPVGFQD
jgi:hypothetical protein